MQTEKSGGRRRVLIAFSSQSMVLGQCLYARVESISLHFSTVGGATGTSAVDMLIGANLIRVNKCASSSNPTAATRVAYLASARVGQVG